jgi:hypothetical protein
MAHVGDSLANARSAGPVGIHADVRVPALSVHVTKPRLKPVAHRCCDRHDALDHLARAIRLQEHTDRVARGESCSEEPNWGVPVDRHHLVTPS